MIYLCVSSDRKPRPQRSPIRTRPRNPVPITRHRQRNRADSNSVFATIEGKVGYRWWLWTFHSRESVVYVLSSGRAADVPEEHFGPVQEGILSVDRYSAYKAMPQVKEGKILLAYCWAHVRRDFLSLARSWPTQEFWALCWEERISPCARVYRMFTPAATTS